MKNTIFIPLLLLVLVLLQHSVCAQDHPLLDRRHRRTTRYEKSALLDFKSSLTTLLESALPNWNDSTDVCNFSGVRCNRWGLHVIRIQLNRMLLEGHLTPSLANLTGLRELDLSDNLLHGPIPPEFSTLRRLAILNLSGNRLSGQIPGSLGLLDVLGYLNLGSNSLEGLVPATVFRNCTRLGVVDLSDNALSGDIPSLGISLKYLFTLNLYSNKLGGKLPRWLSNSSFLIELDVEYNNLSDDLPSEIVQNLKYLQVLHLSYNDMSSYGLDPFFVALSNCSELTELEMAGIGLSGGLPRSVGGLTRHLSALNLEENMITGSIPLEVSNLSSLTLLNLSKNLLKGAIPAEIGKLGFLERLILSDNFLIGSIPRELGMVRSMGLLGLSGNRLSGEIPSSIGNLSRLNELYLHNNKLSGLIPAALGRCTNLNKLDLSHNEFNGRIPEEVSGIVTIFLNLSSNRLKGNLPAGLGKMDQVLEIDLSSNNLTGEILPQLSMCVAVKLVNLSRNSLRGQLPSSLGQLQDLKTFDVSFNGLTGEIPVALDKCASLATLNLSYNNLDGSIPISGVFSLFTNLSFLGNPRLCGRILNRACDRQRRRQWSHSNKKFLIIVCVVASLSAFILSVLCVIGIGRIKGKILSIRDGIGVSGGSSPVMKSHYPRITHRELTEATRDFDNESLVGSGSFGRVYRGVLKDGTVVAVKVLHLQTGNSTKSFNRECQVLKRIRHRNLIRIITACSLPGFKALVLPFMSNGSLERRLHSTPCELSLVRRVSICSDIAEGVAYLHHHSPVKVIHCDLKPSNVLLNDEMTALLSDFGIAKLLLNVGMGNSAAAAAADADNMGTSTVNMLCGSIGYIPPEYGFGSNPSTTGDVYSFGVVVLEVVTRRRPTDEMFHGGLSLRDWVRSQYRERVEEIVDSYLAIEVRSQTREVRRVWDSAIGELLELGLQCSEENPSVRPTMLHAADELDRMKRYLNGDTTATFASSLGTSSSTVGEG